MRLFGVNTEEDKRLKERFFKIYFMILRELSRILRLLIHKNIKKVCKTESQTPLHTLFRY